MTTYTLAQARKHIEAIARMHKRSKTLASRGCSSIAAMPKGSIMRDARGNIMAHKF